MLELLGSHLASRQPHGFQVSSSSGRIMSHAPELERLTRCELGEAMNGMAMEATTMERKTKRDSGSTQTIR